MADTEWNAIKAAQALKVEWTQPQPAFPDNAGPISDHIRNAPVRKREVEKETGNVDEAFKTAARVIEDEYEWPFQSHSSMGRAAASWTSRATRSRYDRLAQAALLPRRGRDPQPAAREGRARPSRAPAATAATMPAIPHGRRRAGARGRQAGARTYPRRRHRLGPEGPASIHRARATIDASARSSPTNTPASGPASTSTPRERRNVLAGHLLGVPLKSGDGFGVPAEILCVRQQTGRQTIAPLLDRASPLRTCTCAIRSARKSTSRANPHRRGASALAVDPVEFRLRHIKDARDTALIKAAAEKAGWQSRPAPRRDQTGNTVSGRASPIRSATAPAWR